MNEYTILDYVPSGIFIIDRNWNIIFWNQTMTKWSGISSESVLNVNLLAAIPAFDKKIYKLRIENIFAQQTFIILSAQLHQSLYADIIPNLNLNTKVIPFTSNSRACAIFYLEDQTPLTKMVIEQKQIGKELLDANIQLIEAKNKAEEGDRLKVSFLQNMSHEIRTPMNGIIGFAKLLNRPNVSEAKIKNYTESISNSAYQLLGVVEDILTMSAIEKKGTNLLVKEVNLNSLLDNVFSIFKSVVGKSAVQMYTSKALSDDEAQIEVDDVKLRQILLNLVGNAVKFTAQGFVEFGYTLVKSGYHVQQNPSESAEILLKFYVKDSGIGIEQNIQNKIFDRFRQADTSITKNYGGTGLGLSISKGLVELMGGKIWVHSVLRQGSEFYFTIPYKSAVAKPIESQTPTKLQTKKTVLIADDQLINTMFISEVLSEMNCEYVSAQNGQEAIEMCKTMPNIDLILMDINMPVLDGYSAALLIKKLRPSLPIVAQTSYALSSEREKYSGTAFDDYITKPIDMDVFVEVITKYLRVSHGEG